MWRLIAAASLALRCSPGSLHPPPKPTSLLEAERGVWRLGQAPSTSKVGVFIGDFQPATLPGLYGDRPGGTFNLYVENGTSQTIFVYQEWIGFSYEGTDRRLRLAQRGHPKRTMGLPADCHGVAHWYVQIRPLERVGLPQTVVFDVLDVKELVVELAWSERPLLGEGGGCDGEREQHLMALERGIVTAKIRL